VYAFVSFNFYQHLVSTTHPNCVWLYIGDFHFESFVIVN